MSSGRTTWWAKDAAWLRRELIVELGEEHGPGGATVLDALSSWAQEQRDDGFVRGGFRSLAREAFVTTEVARAIVEHAAAIGALDELTVDDDGRRFTCRVSGWMADQERGRAAFRKAAQRRDAAGDAAIEDMPQPDGPKQDMSRLTGTDRDKSRSVTPSPLPDQTIEPPKPPTGGRTRDQERYSTELRSWAVGLLPHAPPDEAVYAVKAALALAPRRGDDGPTRQGVLDELRRRRPDLLAAGAGT